MNLPPDNHAVWDHITHVDVLILVQPENLWAMATLREALLDARMEAATGNRAQLYQLVLRANGDVHLMAFGPRGGKRTLWNFGQPNAAKAAA